LESIRNFVDRVVDSKTTSFVARENSKIVAMHEKTTLQTVELGSKAELLYLVTLLLLHSDMGKKRQVKEKYSWLHENINHTLLHEIRIALRSFKSPTSLIFLHLFNKFPSEDEEATSLIQNYTIGLFAPIFKQSIKSRSLIEMAPYQEDFALKVSNLINNQVDCILGEAEWPQRPKALFNLNTFGTGKTTIGSISAAFSLGQANKKLGGSSRLVGIFTLPSLQTSVSFASVVSMTHPTWVIHGGEIIPLFKYSPQYRVIRGRSVFEKYERWAEFQSKSYLKLYNSVGSDFYRQGLNLEAALIEQASQLLRWDPFLADTGRDYISGLDRYQLPVMLFADSESALQLNTDAALFKARLGWHFLNVLDEFPATADCNFDFHSNELLGNVMKILGTAGSFNILMSASPTQEQIEASLLFKEWECTFAEQKVTARSFTQLFTEGGRSVHPFQALSASTFHAVRSWNDTDFRFFTPQVFCEILSSLKSVGYFFPLSVRDVESQDSLIDTIKKICIDIADLSDEVKDFVCGLQINVDVPCSAIESSLTLTSGSLVQEILSSLSPPITHLKVEDLFVQAQQKFQQEILDLQIEMALAEGNREKSSLGSKEFLSDKIEELTRLMSNVEDHTITIKTNLGTNSISHAWYEKYQHRLTDNQLAAVLSGLEVEFQNKTMTAALKESKPKPKKVIDTITSMFGRNDHKTKHVVIKDPNHVIGFDTLKQALARAGRDGLTPVVTGVLDTHLLALFQPGSRTSIPSMDVIKSQFHL